MAWLQEDGHALAFIGNQNGAIFQALPQAEGHELFQKALPCRIFGDEIPVQRIIRESTGHGGNDPVRIVFFKRSDFRHPLLPFHRSSTRFRYWPV